jgi:hypothetical protein
MRTGLEFCPSDVTSNLQTLIAYDYPGSPHSHLKHPFADDSFFSTNCLCTEGAMLPSLAENPTRFEADVADNNWSGPG